MLLAGGSRLSLLMIGILIGISGANISAIHRWLIRDPVYREVIDWSKVEQLTAENG
jgi:hypothetical protein